MLMCSVPLLQVVGILTPLLPWLEHWLGLCTAHTGSHSNGTALSKFSLVSVKTAFNLLVSMAVHPAYMIALLY